MLSGPFYLNSLDRSISSRMGVFVIIPSHMIVVGYYGFTLDVRVSVRPSVIRHFSFLDDNLSKCQWMFMKLGMCIDIVEIWFEMLMG